MVKAVEALSAAHEAEWIAAKIEAMLGGVRSFSIYSGMSDGDTGTEERSPSDFAVLCRASFLFGPIEKAFVNHGIPYRIVDNTPMIQREPCRSAVSAMRGAFYGMTGENEISGMIKKGDSVASIFRTLLMEKETDTGTIALILICDSQFRIRAISHISDTLQQEPAVLFR